MKIGQTRAQLLMETTQESAHEAHLFGWLTKKDWMLIWKSYDENKCKFKYNCGSYCRTKWSQWTSYCQGL